jgi:hypothetical protein
MPRNPRYRASLPVWTQQEVIGLMQTQIDQIGGQAAAARHWHVSKSFVTEVLQCKKNPGPKLLAALRLRQITTIERRYEPAKGGLPRRESVQQIGPDIVATRHGLHD